MTPLPRNYLVWGAAVAAVASLVLAALPLARHLSDGRRAVSTGSPAAQAPPEGSLADPILSWAPFGRPDPPAPPEPMPEAAPVLTLNGVVIATGQAPSRASLSGNGMPQQSFAVGDEVAPGIVLTEVQPDHVVLTVNGKEQILGFPNPRSAPPPAPAVQSDPEPAVGN